MRKFSAACNAGIHFIRRLGPLDIIWNIDKSPISENFVLSWYHAELIILSSFNLSDKLLCEVENEYLDCNHAHFAKHLMQHWKLPPILVNNVFYHHHPSAAQHPAPATIVHRADIITNGLGMGSSGERFVPLLDSRAWEDLGLPINVFEVTVKKSIHQFTSLENTILN